jgi:hypothetical protein
LEFDRRKFLELGALGLGGLSFSSFLSSCLKKESVLGQQFDQVIFITTNGGLSHLDSFDYKPKLEKYHGNSIQLQTKNGLSNARIIKSPFKFKQYGESGKWVSEVFPKLAGIVDQLTFVHSMTANSPNHTRALSLMNTGTSIPGYPSVAGRIIQNIGTRNKQLPGFFVLLDSSKSFPVNGEHNWRSSQISPQFNGVVIPSSGQPMADLRKLSSLQLKEQREQIKLLTELNSIYNQKNDFAAKLEGRSQLFSLALESQTEILKTLDTSSESQATKNLYGLEQKPTHHLAKQLIRARRLVENGVRFVQVYTGGANTDDSWDFHEDVAAHKKMAEGSDRPIAALISDLKQRGLLEKTLVVCAGEFGRLPTEDSDSANKGHTGRDHNASAFTLFMAGGNLRPGFSLGSSDEIGLSVEKNPISYHDIHATIFQSLGIDLATLKGQQNDPILDFIKKQGRSIDQLFS